MKSVLKYMKITIFQLILFAGVPGTNVHCLHPESISGCNVISGRCICSTAPVCSGDSSPYTFANFMECEVNLDIMKQHARQRDLQGEVTCFSSMNGNPFLAWTFTGRIWLRSGIVYDFAIANFAIRKELCRFFAKRKTENNFNSIRWKGVKFAFHFLNLLSSWCVLLFSVPPIPSGGWTKREKGGDFWIIHSPSPLTFKVSVNIPCFTNRLTPLSTLLSYAVQRTAVSSVNLNLSGLRIRFPRSNFLRNVPPSRSFSSNTFLCFQLSFFFCLLYRIFFFVEKIKLLSILLLRQALFPTI